MMNLDDTSLKALIDYYAYMEIPVKSSKAEISNEPHPADIAAMVREEEQGAVGGIDHQVMKVLCLKMNLYIFWIIFKKQKKIY